MEDKGLSYVLPSHMAEYNTCTFLYLENMEEIAILTAPTGGCILNGAQVPYSCMLTSGLIHMPTKAQTRQGPCEDCPPCHGDFPLDEFVYDRRLVVPLLRSHVRQNGRSGVGTK